MTRIPPHSGKDMIAALKQAGFYEHHQRGDHVYLFSTKKEIARPVTVPLYRELPNFIVSKNLKTAGISSEEYVALLGKGRNKKR